MLELILILFAIFIAVSVYWYKQLPKSHFDYMNDYLHQCEKMEKWYNEE